MGEESAGHTYSLTGSFNDWGFIDMGRGQDGETYQCIFPLVAYEEEFQIVVDRDSGKTYYPHVRGAEPGFSILYGPDDASMNRTWCVHGLPGEIVEVTLNLRIEDMRK